MYEFDIPDMSCGHCVKTIDGAIKTADPAAVADIDLANRKARVASKLDPGAIGAAMEAAGYPSTYKAA